ncbi:MAG TPA: hypothetical protein VHS97_08360 [Isosphaeraceae bacterium]|nr:hypothetical protein [Isosphaeraceae bacterium]
MTKLDVINPLNDDLIDQIVDGALTSAQLRAVIDMLDREPDGWKRCALAFLESQCWRETFRLVGEPNPTSLQAGLTSLTENGVHTIRTGRRWLARALSASVVAASFALGWLGHGVHSGPRPGGNVVAESGEPKTEAPNTPRPQSLATTVGDGPRPTVVDGVDPGNEVMMVARLRVGSADSNNSLPILAGPRIDAEWLKNQPPPVSEYGQAILQQHGYQVDQRRRLISATLGDGRRVTVPIDQVQIRYTGNNPL